MTKEMEIQQAEGYYLIPEPLTKKEATLRKQLEEKIFSTVRTFYIELGEALNEIKEMRLYKSTHRCFDDYSREVLDMAVRSAYRYIDAFGIVKNLCAIEHESVTNWSQNQPTFPLPKNESQARALVGLSPEEQREVWQQAIETAPEGKLTAAHVRKTVRTLKGEHLKKTVEKVVEETDKKKRAENKSRMSDEFEEAFKTFLAAVQTEIDGNWKTTDRLTVVNHLDAIRGAISENGNHRIPNRGFSMEMSNYEKLISNGFNIFRMNAKHPIIEKMNSAGEWEIHFIGVGDTPPLAEFEELLLDPSNLSG
jgi:hypothetical protein